MDFDPQAGHEQAGRRPALVLSPKSFNGATSLAFVCPITTNTTYQNDFNIPIPENDHDIQGVALSAHVKSLDWKARNAEFVGKAPPQLIEEVLGNVHAVLDDNED